MRVLMVTAVEAEKDAVLRGLGKDSGRFEVIAGGVGPASAAASTARALAMATSAGSTHVEGLQRHQGYGLVVSVGIGGGFVGRAEVGSLAVASEMIAADLGAESPEGFLSVDKLGFGTSRIAADPVLAERLADSLRAAGLSVALGPIATVSTATGTAESATELTTRIPEVVAEAMEGYGAAEAARQYGVPVLELRAISNAVGPRNRDAWDIPQALHVLEKAAAILAKLEFNR
jgi:futalosine hydrolase